MGAQLEHLKEVQNILLEFSSPDYMSDYFKLKKMDRQRLLEDDNWDSTPALGKFTLQERSFNTALEKTLSGITESEKEFGGYVVDRTFNHFNMAIKPMLEIDVIYSIYSRNYPDDKLTMEEFKPYHKFVSEKYINKMEKHMYEYVLSNFPEVARKPKSPFTLKANVKEANLTNIHSRLSKTGFTNSSSETFINFILKPDIDSKFNWTGTYPELWCFLQGMFTYMLEMPFGLPAELIQWKDYTIENSHLEKRRFSTWLNNKVLNTRITINNEKFDRDEMHVPQNSTAKIQDQLRKKMFKVVKD